MTEQVKFYEHFFDKHISSVIKTKPLQEEVMSSFEEPLSAKSKPVSLIPLDSTYEPSPEPRALKERIIHPLEFLSNSRITKIPRITLGTKSLHFLVRKLSLKQNHQRNG
jgi:hypothetical protein